MTVGIQHLSYYLPPTTLNIEEIGQRLGIPEERLTVYREARRLKYMRVSDEQAGDMAVKAGKKILVESGIDPREIDVVVFFHSMYNVSLAPTCLVGRIQHELGLSRSLGFSISGQGCASINSAIRVSRNMVLSGSARTVLIVGADGVQDSRARELAGITIVGDASSAMILRKGCETNRLVEVCSFDEGYFNCFYDWSEEDRQNFDLVYIIATARLVQRTVRKAGLTLDDITLMIPHNVNQSSWDRVLSLLKFDPSKFFGDNIAKNGHAYGTDIVVNLADAVETRRIRKGDYAVLMTAGIGTFGCTLLQH